MNATQPAARHLAVPTLVTAAVAAWFVLASGAALAEVTEPVVTHAAPAQITMTREGAMKLRVLAVRPAAPAQIAMTPDGSMKLTVMAQRAREANVRTAAARGASHS